MVLYGRSARKTRIDGECRGERLIEWREVFPVKKCREIPEVSVLDEGFKEGKSNNLQKGYPEVVCVVDL